MKFISKIDSDTTYENFISESKPLKNKIKSSHVEKYKKLWQKAFNKIKSKLKLEKLQTSLKIDYDQPIDILTTNRGSSLRSSFSFLLPLSSEKYYIHPISLLNLIWLLILSFSIIYILLWSLFFSAFGNQNVFEGFPIFDVIIEIIFIFDVFFKLNLAYYDNQNILIRERSKILSNYAITWLISDLFTSIPFTLIYLIKAEYNPLWLLFKLGRFRCFSSFFRSFLNYKPKNLKYPIKWLQTFISSDSKVLSLLKIVIPLIIINHMVACLFYICAKLDNFNENTWVVRYSLVHEPIEIQYLASLVWTITTLATVGYGDIVPYTPLEKTLAMVWMTIGIFVLSLSASSLASFYSGIFLKENLIHQKILLAEEFFEYAKIPKNIQYLVKRSIRLNSTYKPKFDFERIFHKLPFELKSEIANNIYNKAASKIPFFMTKSEIFVASVVPMLEFVMIRSQEFLWHKDEFADSIYFIIQGKFQYVYQQKPFISMSEGQYFGDSEIFFRQERKFDVLSKENSKLFKMNRKILAFIKENYENEYKDMRRVSVKRYRFLIQHLAEMIGIKKYNYLQKVNWSPQNLKQMIQDTYDEVYKVYIQNIQKKRLDSLKNKLNIFWKTLKKCVFLIKKLESLIQKRLQSN